MFLTVGWLALTTARGIVFLTFRLAGSYNHQEEVMAVY